MPGVKRVIAPYINNAMPEAQFQYPRCLRFTSSKASGSRPPSTPAVMLDSVVATQGWPKPHTIATIKI